MTRAGTAKIFLSNQRRFWYRGVLAILLGVLVVVFATVQPTASAPLLANYYLGTLPSDKESIDRLSLTDVLILSPEQAITNRATIDTIRQRNPKVILLAYVSARS